MPYNYVISCLIVLFTINSSAQSWNESLADFDLLFERGEVDSALIIGVQALNLNDNPKDTSTARLHGNMAYFYFHSNDLETALKHGKNDYLLRRSLGDTLSYNYCESLYYLAIYHSYLDDPQTASQYLAELHNLYSFRLPIDQNTLINVKLQLANMLAESQQIEAADYYYNDLYLMADSVYAPLDSNKLAIHNTISQFYFTNGLFDKAEPYYVGATELMKEQLGELSEYHLISLNSLGQFYIYSGKYKKQRKPSSHVSSYQQKFMAKNQPTMPRH